MATEASMEVISVSEEETDKCPKQQRTLDSFFMSPPKKAPTSKSSSSSSANGVHEKPLKQKGGNLDSSKTVPECSTKPKSSESKSKSNKCKKTVSSNVKNNVKKEKLHNEENGNDTQKQDKNVKAEPVFEEISYQDFLKQRCNGDIQNSELVNGSKTSEQEPTISHLAPDVPKAKEDCDLDEALGLLENSVDEGKSGESSEREHVLNTQDTNSKDVVLGSKNGETECPEDVKTKEHVIENGHSEQSENQINEAVVVDNADETESVKKPKQRLKKKKKMFDAEGTVTDDNSATGKKRQEAVADGCKDDASADEQEIFKPRKRKVKSKLGKSKAKDENEAGEDDGHEITDEKKVVKENKDSDDDSETLPSQPPKGCVAITSFFATGPKKSSTPRQQKEQDSSEVTIMAVIHPEPSPPMDDPNQPKIFGIFSKKPAPTPALVTPKQCKKQAKKTMTPKCNAVVEKMDMSITHIMTEVITIEDEKKPKQVRKCSNEEDADETQENVEQEKEVPNGNSITIDDSKEGVDQNLAGECKEKVVCSDNSITNILSEENIQKDSETMNTSELTATEKKAEQEKKAARAAELTAQFAELDNISFSKKKTAQATLNFGGKCMAIKKPEPKPAAKSKKTTRVRTKSTRDDAADSDDEVFSSPPPKKRKKTKSTSDDRVTASGKKPKRTGTEPKDDGLEEHKTPPRRSSRTRRHEEGIEKEEVEPEEAVTPRKRRLLSSIYKTTMVHPVNAKKRTPLKLKFIKIGDLKQADDEAFTPKSKAKKQLSMNKAQQLLSKAKGKTKTKSPACSKVTRMRGKEGKSTKTTSPPVTLRRSSRSSSLTASKIIGISFEVDERPRKQVKQPCTPIKKQSKEKKTPKKEKPVQKSPRKPQTPRKSPKKTPSKSKQKGAKLASIFAKPSKQTAKSTAPISVSDDTEEEAELTEEQKENQRIRREFLLSGVPQALKRQISTQEAVTSSEYAPLPTTSHVTQKLASAFPLGCDPWSLAKNSLSGVVLRPADWCVEGLGDRLGHYSGTMMQLGSMTLCKETCPSLPDTQVSKMTCPSIPFKDEVVKLLLAEIATHNVSFPVRRMYRQLCASRKAVDSSENTQSTAEAAPQKEEGAAPAKSVKKRKQSIDGERSTRSKRRRGPSDDDVVLLDTSATEAKESPTPDVNEKLKDVADPNDNGQDVLWTDKYSPMSSAGILGNTMTVKKVKSWLVEWKHRTDLEMRKLRKEQLKEAKKQGKTKEEIKKLSVEWWASDDSDFDLTDDSDDSTDSEAEDTMCNTALITGPHGTGKTALVYALARELGYKVFEVNASTRRNGKHILSQLQEATQSHQVTKHKLDDVYKSLMSEGKASATASTSKPKPKVEKKLPTSFANFFKKTEDPPKAEEPEGKANKKRSRRSKEPTETDKETKSKRKSKGGKTPKGDELPKDDKPRKGLKLSSVSLILFDEVDLVFEEDKGFWAAIQTFMSTTKRPIVLTATDSNFLDKFKSRVEQHTLKTPSVPNVTSYLQLVCLCENLRTDHSDISSLVALHKSDLRTLLLLLQYWAASGASWKTTQAPIKYKRTCLKESDQASKNLQMTPMKSTFSAAISADSQSADEFELQKPKKRARRCIIEDDDTSRDGFHCPSPIKAFQSPAKGGRPGMLSFLHDDGSSQGFPSLGSSQEQEADDLVEVPLDGETPPIHDTVMATICGWSSLLPGEASSLLKTLGDDSVPTSHKESLCAHFRLMGVDLLYANRKHLLPLKKIQHKLTIPKPVVTDTPVKACKRRTRVMVMDDLYDSEASSDGFVTLSQQSTDNRASQNSAAQDTNSNDVAKVKPVLLKNPKAAELVQDSLESMSEYYDSLSLLDSLDVDAVSGHNAVHSRHRFEYDRARGRITPGLGDDVVNFSLENSERSSLSEIMSSVALRSFSRAKSRLEQVQSSLKQSEQSVRDEAENLLSIPVEELKERLWTDSEEGTSKSLAQCICRAADGIACLLPNFTCGQRVAMTTEYVPTIRAMCKMEQIRCVVQNKRRFFHHLAPMINQMRKSTLNTLCTTFH